MIDLAPRSLSQKLINLARENNDRLSEVSMQLSSQVKHTDYKGYADDGTLKQLITLEDARSAITGFKRSNNIVTAKLNESKLAVDEIINETIRMQQTLTARNNSASGEEIQFNSIANHSLDRIANLLNKKFNGRYLFAGSKTDTEPVQNIQISNLIGDQASSSYYKGNSVTTSIQINSYEALDYGTTANEEGFQKLIASIHMGLDGDATKDNTKLINAGQMLNTALEQLTEIRSKLSLQIDQIDNANEVLDNADLLLSKRLNTIRDTDILEASTKQKELEVVLSATYSSFNRISKLTLANFLSN